VGKKENITPSTRPGRFFTLFAELLLTNFQGKGKKNWKFYEEKKGMKGGRGGSGG